MCVCVCVCVCERERERERESEWFELRGVSAKSTPTHNSDLHFCSQISWESMCMTL